MPAFTPVNQLVNYQPVDLVGINQLQRRNALSDQSYAQNALNMQEQQGNISKDDALNNLYSQNPNATTQQAIQAGGVKQGTAAQNDVSAANQRQTQSQTLQKINTLSNVKHAVDQIANDPSTAPAMLQQIQPHLQELGVPPDKIQAFLSMPPDQAQASSKQFSSQLGDQIAQLTQQALPLDKRAEAANTMTLEQYKQSQDNARNTNTVNSENSRSAASLAETKRAHDLEQTRMQGDPAQVESAAQAIANYQEQLPPGGRSTPFNRAVNARVLQIRPDYSAGKFPEINKAMTAFGSGKQGDQVRFANTAVSHLDQFNNLIDATNNGDYKTANSIVNWFKEQLGDPSITNVQSVARVLGQEVTKAVVANGGGQAEREEAQSAFDSKLAPQVLRGNSDQYIGLLGGQIQGLQRQYEDSTQQKDFGNKLSPRVAAILQKRAASEAQGASAAPASGAPLAVHPPAIQALLSKYQ